MKTLSYIALALTSALALSSTASAQTTELSLDALEFTIVHDVAERSILARNAAGQPLVALLKLDEGDFLPPHGEGGGLRMITVISGELSWGDGSQVEQTDERLFGPGALLVLPPQSGAHWAAARSGEVLLQVTFVRDGSLAASAASQVTAATD